MTQTDPAPEVAAKVDRASVAVLDSTHAKEAVGQVEPRARHSRRRIIAMLIGAVVFLFPFY